MRVSTERWIPVAALVLVLSLGGCVQVWQRIADVILPKHETAPQATATDAADIPEGQIAALVDFETAAGPPPTQHPAVVHIENLGHEVLTILSDPSMSEAERTEFFSELLARDLDIPLIARFVLGRHWNTATPEQRQTYTEIFSQFLVQTYSARLGGVEIDDFTVLNAKNVGDKDILVFSHVAQGSGQPVRANWRVREREGGFRILDLSVEGISMAVMLRQEFASILRKKNGVDGLIDMLKERTT